MCAGEDKAFPSFFKARLEDFHFTWDSVDLFSFILEIASGTNILCSDIAQNTNAAMRRPRRRLRRGDGGDFLQECSNGTSSTRSGHPCTRARSKDDDDDRHQGPQVLPSSLVALLDAEHPSSVKSLSLTHPRRWRGGTSANHSASHRRTTRTSRDYRTSGGRSRVRRGGWRATALDRTTLGRRGGGDTIPTGNDSLVVVGGGCIGRWSKLRSNLTCYARQRGRRD